MMTTINLVQLQKNLNEIDYPVSKTELIMYAEQTGVDEGILRALKQLPLQHYETAADVSKAISTSFT